MEHHAPHKSSVMEGYYSKFNLDSGSSIAIVVSRVQGKAITRPNMISFTYIPPDSHNLYQKEIWADQLDMIKTSKNNAFSLEIPSIGHIRFHADGTTTYLLKTPDYTFTAQTTSQTPWSPTTSTPEGYLVHLPLPLHWHVHSLASLCTYNLTIPALDLPSADKTGQATVHEEKNWSNSFPSAHIWLQARSAKSSFCCAGGSIIGAEAFLLGYRSSDLNFDFRPPFALRFAGIGPFMSYKSDWENRSFEMSVQSFRRKITVKAEAPEGTFFSLSSPFPEGHRENFLGQSFKATIEISIHESGWTGPWKLVRKDVFEDGSLEFGGDYYPPAGSSVRFH